MSNIEFSNLNKSFGKNKIITNFNLKGKEDEFLVLVGPSGCGKSTLLRMIAGLEKIDEGEIKINNQIINDLHPSKRQTAMVFQSYALYPHMNVHENMSFGLKIEKKSKEEIQNKVLNAAKILKIEELLERRPKELSGGQRQRVAIGRAITRNPKIFLFDEPLSNLDAALRAEMRVEISKLHQQIKTNMIYVTHDQVEAMTLADRIVILNKGNIEQVGTPDEIYKDPDNIFVAQFIGTPKMNILECNQKEGYIYLSKNKKTNIKTKKENIFKIGVRPDSIEICKPAKNILNGNIKFCEYLGSEQYVYIDCKIKSKLIIVKLDPNIKIVLNEKIGLKFFPKYLHFFSKDDKRIN